MRNTSAPKATTASERPGLCPKAAVAPWDHEAASAVPPPEDDGARAQRREPAAFDDPAFYLKDSDST